MNTSNNQSTQLGDNQISALRGTSEAHQPDMVLTAKDNKIGAIAALITLRDFVGQSQLTAMCEVCYSEEADFMNAKLVELAIIVEGLPKTYETEEQQEKIVRLHYFKGGCDWYIIEKDMEKEQHQAFGSADLGYGPELGYISIVELLENGVELDLYWTPKRLSECGL